MVVGSGALAYLSPTLTPSFQPLDPNPSTLLSLPISSAPPPPQTYTPKSLAPVLRPEAPLCPLAFEAFPPLPSAFEPPVLALSGNQAIPQTVAEPAICWSKPSRLHSLANLEGSSCSWSDVVHKKGVIPSLELKFYPPQVVDGEVVVGGGGGSGFIGGSGAAVAAAPASGEPAAEALKEEKRPEKEEESDDEDMGLSLFD